MTYVVSVCSQKGGVAKTTTTMSLAAVAAEAGRVLVVDTDPQQSAVEWAERAGDNLPFEIADSTDPAVLRALKRANQFDVVFVDTPGSLGQPDVLNAVLDQSDYAILPMEAAALSIKPTERVLAQFIQPRDLPFRILLNKVRGLHSTDLGDMREYLSRRGLPAFATAIRLYVAHERAPLTGEVVTQYPKSRETSNAIDDYRRTFTELMMDWNRSTRPGTAAGAVGAA